MSVPSSFHYSRRMDEDPFSGPGRGGIMFSPIPKKRLDFDDFVTDDDFQLPADLESGWDRMPQQQVLDNRNIPLILARVPNPNVKAGEITFIAEVFSRDIPANSSGSFYLEVVPWSYDGKNGPALSPPEPGFVGGFELPLVNDPTFNRHFYLKKPVERAHVLFKIEPDFLASNWVYSIPDYAFTTPRPFVMAVDDGKKDPLGQPVLNVRIFKPQNRIGACQVCQKVAPKRCKVCKKVRYCGTKCRDVDWPKHKNVCVKN